MNRLVAVLSPLAVALVAAACSTIAPDDKTARTGEPLAINGAVNGLGHGGIDFLLRTSVLTQHNDNARTGANLREYDLNTSNVNKRSFGKLYDYKVTGQVYAQPLYVSQLTRDTNAVYVATEENNVYAFDADVPGKTLWSVSLGLPVPSSLLRFFPGTDNELSCGDLVPSVGITSTPVIDLTTRTIFLVAKTLELSGGPDQQLRSRQVYRLHALSIDDGLPRPNSGVEIRAQVTGNDGVQVRFDASHQLQRPGLVLTHGRVYMGFGGHCDIDPYHGWVLGYDAKTLTQTGVFNTTPTGGRGGVWQAGAGIAANAAGDLFITTGNGSSDLAPAPRNFASSLIELHPAPDGSLSVQSYFMPWNADFLNGGADGDLGSGGPMLVPGTNLVLGGGKEGIYVTERQGDLEGFIASSGGKNFVQRFDVGGYYQPGGALRDQIFGGAAFWDGPTGAHLYVWPTGHPLLSFEYGVRRRPPHVAAGKHLPAFLVPPDEGALPDDSVLKYRGSTVAVSARGSQEGSGIVWTVSTVVDGGGQTRLSAFDASDIGTLLWTSDDAPARDALAGFSKYVAPTIVDGKVFMPTTYGVSDGRLVVYGLDPAPLGDAGDASDGSDGSTCGVVGDPPPTGDWTELYEKYLKAGSPGSPVTTLGHCGNCHVGAGFKSFGTGDNSSSQTCAGLKKSVLFGHTAAGAVDLTTTTIADPAKTLLVWFGGPLGRMPPAELGLPKPTCNARAAAAVTAWVAAGAICPP